MSETSTTTAAAVDWSAAPLNELIDHIYNTHHVFLREHMPKIRARLEKLLQKDPEKMCGFIPPLSQTYFALEEELYNHLLKEERILFPYIKQIEASHTSEAAAPAFHCGSVAAPIGQMEHEHANGKQALEKMRELTGGYPMTDGMCLNRKGLFDDLIALEADLHQHMHLENDILHVRAVEMEKELAAK
jgi:regulator of cell morphogenesis and NO signaling